MAKDSDHPYEGRKEYTGDVAFLGNDGDPDADHFHYAIGSDGQPDYNWKLVTSGDGRYFHAKPTDSSHTERHEQGRAGVEVLIEEAE